MRAALFDRYGGPHVLYIGEVPVPAPSQRQAIVRVEASSINGGEVAGRRGDLRLLTSRRFPKRTGVDFVGTVVGNVESTTEHLPVGTRVWGTVDDAGAHGAQAGYVVVEPSRYAAAPQGLTSTEAASLLAGGTTALRGIRDLAGLRPGERLLVRGAAGGVGSVAVQLGKHLGAHVTGLASPSSADFVRAQGADVVVDYATPPEQLGLYDVIFDTRGTELGAFRRRLAPRGRMVTVVPDLRRPLRSLGRLQLERLRRTRTLRIFFGDPDRGLVDEVTRLVDAGALRPVLDTVVPLDEIVAAHARLERGGVRGKVVVKVADTA